MSVELPFAHAVMDLRRHAAINHRCAGPLRTETEPCVRVLGLPFGVEKHALPDNVRNCFKGELPDLVLLTEPNSAALLARSLCQSVSAIVPVVDATRELGCDVNQRRSDLSIGAASRHGIGFAAIMLSPMIRRLHEVPSALLQSHDPHLWLLARLYVRNRHLQPRRDPAVKEIFVYNDDIAVPRASVMADELVRSGLLERRFYDALTVCPHCDSARLIVRECCTACGSAHLFEQTVLHHMRCAYQGPERDFRLPSGELQCPKCRQRLQQFSVDYDRPGWLYLCRDCGHASGDASVGFTCLDCEAHIPSAHMATREIYDYGLTAAARACVLSGRMPAHALTSSQGIMERLQAFIRDRSASGQPFCVLGMRLRERPDTPVGGRAWQQTVAFFGALLHECFTPETEIIETSDAFFALLGCDSKAEVEKALPEIRARLECHLALAPEVEYSVYGPEEFRAFANLISAQ